MVKRQIGDQVLNTRPAKDEENKIGIGCDLVEIAKVRCKVRHMTGLLCAKIVSPWYNCCFSVSVVLISKFNILSIGNITDDFLFRYSHQTSNHSHIPTVIYVNN